MNDEVYRRSGDSERLAGVQGEGLRVESEKSKIPPKEEFELDKTLNPNTEDLPDSEKNEEAGDLRHSPFAERIKRVKEGTAKIWSLITRKDRSLDQ